MLTTTTTSNFLQIVSLILIQSGTSLAAHFPPFPSFGGSNFEQLYRHLDSFLGIFYAFIGCLSIVLIICCLYGLFWMSQRALRNRKKRREKRQKLRSTRQGTSSPSQATFYTIRTSCITFDSLNPLAVQRKREEKDLPPTYDQLFSSHSVV